MLSRTMLSRVTSGCARRFCAASRSSALPGSSLAARAYTPMNTSHSNDGSSSSTSSAATRRTMASSSSSSSSASQPHALSMSSRFVQFDQTSETMKGINTKNKGMATKWITKSTKDYVTEADSKQRGAASVTEQRREDLKERTRIRNDRLKQSSKDAVSHFETEMDRIGEDKSRRWKKGINFMKRQGKSFVLLYVITYLGMWLLLYIGFASEYLKKDAAFEWLVFFLGKYIDREKFFKRIEAFDSYVNVGFAFLINEMLEFIRLPLLMSAYFTFRPFLLGLNTRVKGSIFKRRAAES